MGSRPLTIDCIVRPEDDQPRGVALLVDDESTSRLILKSLLIKNGFTVVEAVDGQESVELFEECQPDIVFMDVMMPIMDGHQAAAQIKKLCGEVFVPIIFLTAITDEAQLAKCIEVGGDDFLVKPYNHITLRAKILAMERIRNLHRKVSALYAHISREEEIAEQVFSNAVLVGNVSPRNFNSYVRPAGLFSGDTLLTGYSGAGDVYVLLGDFTGHGLAAALGALPVSEVFRTMVKKGADSRDILLELNYKLRTLLPANMFMAAQFVKIKHDLSGVEIFNCGMPDVMILGGKDKGIIKRVSSGDLALGISQDFLNVNAEHYTLKLNIGDRIILTTDGVIEAQNANDEEFGERRFQQSILESSQSDPLLEKAVKALNDFCGGATQMDDISIAEIIFSPELIGNPQVMDETEMESSLGFVG